MTMKYWDLYDIILDIVIRLLTFQTIPLLDWLRDTWMWAYVY